MDNFTAGVAALWQLAREEIIILSYSPIIRGFLGGYLIATLIFAFIYSRQRRCDLPPPMAKKNIGKKIITALALALFFLPNSALANMGISPPTVQVDDILQNVPYVITVRVYREVYDKDQLILVTFDGTDARFLEGESQFFMPSGMQYYEYELTILPKQAAVGEYSARVDFAPEKPDTEIVNGTGTAVRRGVSLILGFSVTGDELVDFAITNVEYFPVEEDGEVTTQFDVVNEGNVEWRPDSVVITIVDPVTGEVIGTETISGSQIDYLAPGESMTITQLLSLTLPTGNYIVTADFMFGGEVVYTESHDLEVLPAGTLSQIGELTKLKASKEIYSVGEVSQLIGYFSNLGQVPYVGTMTVEIYDLGNNSLFQTVFSDQLSIDSEANVIFDATAVLDRAGDFRAVAFVDYGKKQSGTQQVTFKVESPSVLPVLPSLSAVGSGAWWPLAAAVLGGIIFILLIFFLVKRRKIKPPVVNSPIYVGAVQISGTAKAKDGAAVEVYIGTNQIGMAVVQSEQWSYTAKPGELQVGQVVKGILRIDSNHDRKIDLSDRSSQPSRGVTVTAAPASVPVTPAPVPVVQVVVNTPPAPAPTPVVVTPPVVNSPPLTPSLPVSEPPPAPPLKGVESTPPPEDNWTISL